PLSLTVNQGSNATFSIVASGTSPVFYQWKFVSTNLPGATLSSFTRTNVQPNHAGNYFVIVSNVAGTVTSSNAFLTVNAIPAQFTSVLKSNSTTGLTFSFSPGRTNILQASTNLTVWTNVN